MASPLPRLENDTVINVAQLLKQPVGAARTVEADLDSFRLDQDLWAHGVRARVRLTRIATGILAAGEVDGTARLECVRCLTEFDAPFSGTFDAEFRPTVEVRTGEPLPLPEDNEIFLIDNNHQLDLAEILRQVAILGLPMRPVCGDQCPGFEAEVGEGEQAGDDRLAVLRSLLEESPE